MISFKDFARENSISYEAVRQQCKRYSIELDGHIYKEGRTQFLDDYAVEFLKTKRQKNPVVVLDLSKDEELEHLRQENKSLLIKLTEAQDSVINFQSQLFEVTKFQQQLVAARAESDELREELLSVQRQLSEKTDALSRLQAELEIAQSRRGFFARIFGR